ncbi:MAG: hypothetical protein A2542_02780 [Parcubacteria group bacterium RIFOXYD2_FULL_52_8]|nr:MAG: hypothetical protein A2542_02780 [Parcubacteria group bacterium RIFOXYD2_FULL_52_8]
MFFSSKIPEDYTKLTDEQLLAASLRTPSLYKFLIDRYADAFRRRARAIIGDREEVEDVLQETFTRMYMKASHYQPQPGAVFSSWAYMILTNVSFTYYQKLKRRGLTQVNLEQDAFEALPEVLVDQHGARLTEEYVVSILVRMPAALAQVLRLHFIDDEPHKDIAIKLGISLTAVKARIHRAKKAFREIQQKIDSRSELLQFQGGQSLASVSMGMANI